ncbi:hypothetical protein M0802_008499 [Mischocyttarus mexicanus]|nr:hypothetical protein M0802_008499 [Mischocyttarus mexicanus]
MERGGMGDEKGEGMGWGDVSQTRGFLFEDHRHHHHYPPPLPAATASPPVPVTVEVSATGAKNHQRKPSL